MNKFIQFSGGLLVGALLVGCGGGGSSSSAGGKSSNMAQVSIDAMTSVPVINGSATQGTLYVHNYGATAVNGVSFNLGAATTKTKMKSALAKLGVNLGGYEDANGFVLINPERCDSIPASGSCAVNFTTPSLSVGNLGNSLVKLSYNSGHGSQSTSQVVNYNYVNLAASSGVNFTGSLNVTGAQGSTQHIVGYMYGGGVSGSIYKGVNLNSTNATIRISNGFINGQEVAAGQVMAVEFAVAMQNSKSSSVNVTPSWGVSRLQSSSVAVAGSGLPLTLSLTPSQAVVNYIFGNVPVLNAPTTGVSTIYVTNNGNANGTGGLTATATGANANDLIIDYTNCSSTSLLANAVNNCQITFATNSYTSGSTTVEYKDSSGTIIGSQLVVWTNDKPFPAVSIVPTPTNVSIGKGVAQSDNSIIFTFTNVGQAPLTNVTYPVTNTGLATWTQDSSNCNATIGALDTCEIKGHLSGTDDGVGKLYIKAVGSFNSVNYSFVALPVSYSVTANPSLEITPNSVSVTLLANGVDVKSQTYTVKNVGNDPALFTGITLNDSSSNVVKPSISGGGTCTNNTTLAENTQCSVVVTYGPAAANLSANESGISTLQVDYHGGTPDTSYNTQATFNYKLVGNDSSVEESTTVTGLTGAGTSGDPYVGNANLDPMKLTFKFMNPSVNYPMTNFNVNTNELPFGLVVDGTSTCTTGAAKMNIESNGGSCTLVLALDRTLLSTAGGSVILDFNSPTATWTTPLGFYSQPGSRIYMNYMQPTVVFALSQNNANFKSTVLSITGSNLDKGANPLSVDVSGVKYWLESSPVNPSSNCTVNSSTYAVNCTLTPANNVESVTYVMPNYLQSGESADIPLIFSTSANAFLSPSYTFINYLEAAPVPPILAINLPQTGQEMNVPTGCSTGSVTCYTSVAGTDGYGYLSSGFNIPYGIAWAYNGSGALNPTTRFTVDSTGNCITDNLTGLMWIKDLSTINNGALMSWQDALGLVATANSGAGYCGHTDWYLPTVNDLASLLNDGQASQATWLNSQGFSNVLPSFYWSSSTSMSSPNSAWVVYFTNGNVIADVKTHGAFVWPVRLAQ